MGGRVRTTLRDIARQAKVHTSTVAHVLNGAGGNTRVSSETRERVLEAAAALGYSANRAAQQLKTGRSRVIGMLVGDLENPFFARMVALCSEALEREGYDIILAVRRDTEINDLHLLQGLVSRQLDGLLLWSETLTEVRDRVQQPDMERTVIMGLELPGRDCASGLMDVGLQAALNHLLAQGRTKIGYLAPALSIGRTGDPRHDTYTRELAGAGLPPRIYTYDGVSHDAAAARACAEAICRSPDPPDALLCFNDMAAIGALMGVRHAGLRVPHDIALVGCDDIPLAAQMDVPLSSIAYPLPELCAAAARMLIERVRAWDDQGEQAMGNLPARLVQFPTVLRVRASSDPASGV